ncbi:RIP metalloprotease RseP [Bacillus sp. AFS002410]|uniref:RIP metalloprotease RseP n=1 Tax=Bacillus sp. AFS002410 TaxID=2033481 RepID=UPI000BEF2BF7|nr:RIP metalloprotease RseP [Bacillus sp. AFS002410]PEJ60221.1 RIP metalloprotease RseP [Bacillus sp. AFS002410]
MNTVIAFIVIFGALVFFHELGHLYFAKRAGILCREFAIGFGPKVFSFFRNETTYTIRLLPLGGYVRYAGEDPEMVQVKPGSHIGLQFNANNEVTKIVVDQFDRFQDLRFVEVDSIDLEHKLEIIGIEEGSEEVSKFNVNEKAFVYSEGQGHQIAPYNRQFNSKSVGKRAIAIFAGPMMNFILALVIFILLGLLQGTPVNDAKIGKLLPKGAAQTAGLKEGDAVLSIDNHSVSKWAEVVKVVRESPGKELLFKVKRDNKTISLPVTPKSEEIDHKVNGLIGVYAPVEKNVFSSIKYGITETYGWTKEIVLAVGHLVTGQFSINNLSGPVGIYQVTDQAAHSGIFYLMKWAAFLSINLGIMNLLPLPALDGGRLTFFAIEALRGRPIDRQKEGVVHFIGFALLMLLMIIVTWNDIKRLFL